jgi:predicted transcriptional regulator
MRALSIRQPYAEQILLGKKRVEYRSIATSILNERVYIYASARPASPSGKDLPRGVIIGTVEVVACRRGRSGFEWHLRRPKRLARHLKPTSRPQPVWFRPFSR